MMRTLNNGWLTIDDELSQECERNARTWKNTKEKNLMFGN